MTKLLVIGANGQVGSLVARLLGPANCYVATRADGFRDPTFAHFRLEAGSHLPAAAFAGVSAVINAAGRVHGDEGELREANVKLPLSLAEQARKHGVRKLVQVSSFSVYGAVEHIDATTSLAPITAYGRSKAEGDEALADESDATLSVESVRVPFLFGPRHPGLLGPLTAIARRLRILPVSRPPVRRSMLTYEKCAHALVAAAKAPARSGITHAADSHLFDFSLFARLFEEENSERVRLLPIPQPLGRAIRPVMPALHRRLMQSSVLAESANLMRDDAVPGGLAETIRHIVRKPRADERNLVDSDQPNR